MDTYQVITSDFVKVVITSSLDECHPVERRFQKDLTIQRLKDKLELLTGGRSTSMKLEVYDRNNTIVCQLNDDERLLGSYPVDDGMRLHVIDHFKQLDDLSQVEKFELSAEDYDKKSDTVKAFLQKNQLGKYNKDDMIKKEQEIQKNLDIEEQFIKTMKVTDRCEVSVPNNPKRRGTIMYLGKTDFKSGFWVGIKYDEPLGKNNGTVNGKKYFECLNNYGGFVKPNHVVTGDFAEEDFGLNDEL